jgi:hypothetical protein
MVNSPDYQERRAFRQAARGNESAGSLVNPGQAPAMAKMNAERPAPATKTPPNVASAANPASKPAIGGPGMLAGVGQGMSRAIAGGAGTVRSLQDGLGKGLGAAWGNAESAYNDAQRARNAPLGSMDDSDLAHNIGARRSVGVKNVKDIAGGKPAYPR